VPLVSFEKRYDSLATTGEKEKKEEKEKKKIFFFEYSHVRL